MTDKSNPTAPRTRILVVEDNESYRQILVNALRTVNFEVLDVGNGLRGLEIARTEQIDLAIVDIYMPEMDGLSMLEEMKKDEKLQHIPVVMLTNVQEELENSVKKGADEAILKASLTPRQVIDVCKKHLVKKEPIPESPEPAVS